MAAGTAAGPPLGSRVRYVGDYELLGELGRGGMGVVYKAQQSKLQRLVALKMVLAGEYAGVHELARFRSEAQAVARLQHPNIVQIYEVGEHDGHPYFSLEFCPGGSLDRKLQGTPLPPREAAVLLETLAQAMHAAHLAGVVHRDLKPANVLLSADGTPKITDFGLAKKLDGESGVSTPEGQTASGAILGTPSYMAPEQAGGKTREVGPEADVYALGAILYELLTGRPPFQAATPLDTLLQVIHEDPVSPWVLQPQVPRDLETICLKCLHKDSNKRYATAEDLAEDLRRFLAGEPIRARPVGAAERLVKWVRRRPAVAGLGGVSILALLALAGESLQLWRLPEAPPPGKAGSAPLPGGSQPRDQAVLMFMATLSGPGWCVDFSPDGKRLAAGLGGEGRPGEVKVWDLASQQEVLSLSGSRGAVFGVVYSKDGKHLASASGDGTGIVWEAATGRQIKPFVESITYANGLALSPDGKYLAFGGSYRTVRL